MATSTVDKARIPGLKYKDTDEKSWDAESKAFKSAVIMHYVPGNPITPFGLNHAKPFTTKLLISITLQELITSQFKGTCVIQRCTFAEIFKIILKLAAAYNKRNHQYNDANYSSQE